MTANNAMITNTGKNGAIRVTKVDVQAGTFEIGNFDDFTASKNSIALSINGCSTKGAGSLTLVDGAFPAIAAEKKSRHPLQSKSFGQRSCDEHQRRYNRLYHYCDYRGGVKHENEKICSFDAHPLHDALLSISAFAASDTIASGTIPDSKSQWELDSQGWLTISGSGEAPVFQSADDQPWVEYREQITEVWYDDMEALTISDLAYWFEGCTALTTAELPLAPVIGTRAFYGCSKLNTIMTYYGEQALKSVGTDAFWRDSDTGGTLYIGIRYDYPGRPTPSGSTIGPRPTAAHSTTRMSMASVWTHPSLALARAASKIHCKASTLGERMKRVVMPNTINVIGALTHSILGLTSTKTMELVQRTAGPAPSCGTPLGCCKVQQPASCTANGYADYSCVCGQTKSK